MRLEEFAKKKVHPVYDPVEAARESLEYEKEQGMTKKPNGTLQLFVPRKIERFHTKKERRDHVYKEKAKYGFDDEGNMIPQYQDWISQANESINLDEGAPIIAGGAPVPPGDNKPNALLWTSTAYQRKEDGKWTSDWHNYVMQGGLGSHRLKDQSKIGYLYKVKPCCVLDIDDTNDARVIYEIFYNLGRANKAYKEPSPEEIERFKNHGNWEMLLINDFPWDEIANHFDCVHHWGRTYFGSTAYDFCLDWDVESSVWFSPRCLELLGQIPLWNGEDPYED